MVITLWKDWGIQLSQSAHLISSANQVFFGGCLQRKTEANLSGLCRRVGIHEAYILCRWHTTRSVPGCPKEKAGVFSSLWDESLDHVVFCSMLWIYTCIKSITGVSI